MKIHHLLLIVSTLIFLVLSESACKKNDEDTGLSQASGTGTVKYQGKSYTVKYGLYEYYGEFEGIHNFELYLFSDGVDLDNEKGRGTVIDLYFYSNVPPLPTGTIPYYIGATINPPVFDARAGLDYNLETQDGIAFNGFDYGELTITRNGDNYTIQFTLQTDDGETVSGQYSGKVGEF